MEAQFVIVGGGIAGVTCAETLAYLQPESSVILVSESPLIKAVTNLKYLTKMISRFDVEERQLRSLTESHPNVTVLHDGAAKILDTKRTVLTKRGETIAYRYLCLCNGGKPKLVSQAVADRDLVVGIRDTDSVEKFRAKLRGAKRIAVVGNGGIASELVYKLQNVDIDWIVKDKHIAATFVDPGAAEFFQTQLNKTDEPAVTTVSRRLRYDEETDGSGAALGPDWYKNVTMQGSTTIPRSIKVHYSSEIRNIVGTEPDDDYPLKVTVVNDPEPILCDLVVSATGVTPNSNLSTESPLALSDEGGINVNEKMLTSVPYVYAAGDVCSPAWTFAKHWFPMKLWSQARQMGFTAAKCMSAASEEDATILQDFCYELFTHSTNLFGYKVVLLGLYNGQKLGTDYECLLRMTPGKEYVKFVLENNRLQGAVLIGETDLEETCENLILNQLDLSPYGDDILDPNIDIEDYFD